MRRPNVGQLVLANSELLVCVCERNNMLANCWQKVKFVSVLANFLPTSYFVINTCQFEFANTSWPTLV